MSKAWSIPIAVLFCLALLTTSYHHHADLNDHPSCICCKLAKDLSSAQHTVHPATSVPYLLENSSTVVVYRNPGIPCVSLTETRAPPV